VVDARPPWQLLTGVDVAREDELTDRLVEHNLAASEAVVDRFRPGNLATEPVHVFAVGDDGRLLGGCAGRVERVWHWLNVDTLWVDAAVRGRGLGRVLLGAVEAEAVARGCRWSDVTTFEFQAPRFYVACGYEEYAVKHDYPPGHRNHFLRKAL